jgi:hypothetical protein
LEPVLFFLHTRILLRGLQFSTLKQIKKIPNCLQKSPARNTLEESAAHNILDDGNYMPASEEDIVPAHNTLDDGNDVAASEEDIVPALSFHNANNVPEPRKTTRKRKRFNEKNSPVDAIAGQSKPAGALSVGPDLGQAKPPKKKPRIHEVEDIPKPPGVHCKKKKGGCNHEVVFDIHYNKKLWDKYAETVQRNL